MADVEKLIIRMLQSTKGARFTDLVRVCEAFFGEARQSNGSHCVYKTPWKGDPRVNIQNDKGVAKPYQVKQVLRAIDRLQSVMDQDG